MKRPESMTDYLKLTDVEKMELTRLSVQSEPLLALSAKWRHEADDLDVHAKYEPNLIAAGAYNGFAERIRRMADELDSVNKVPCAKEPQ